jgi:hypothetical protein
MAAKKKTAEKKTYGNKTKFVLGLPRDMSAKQVVAEGKKQGIVLSEAHVYKIRSTAKTKGVSAPVGKRGRAAKAPAGKASAASAASAAAKGGEVSKRDFVLSFGPEVKASEILRQAKDAGIGLSKAYLYTIRSSGGASVRRGPAAPASKGQATAFARVKSGVTALEAQFIDAAIDMGLSKASDLLERLRSRLKTGL